MSFILNENEFRETAAKPEEDPMYYLCASLDKLSCDFPDKYQEIIEENLN